MAVSVASLTPRDYVDADVYQREAESVLAAGWLPMGRVDQLRQTGSRLAITLLGRPLVAVNDGTAIRVLGNVCAHRGSMILEDGVSSGATIVCPHHRWAYRLDGS